MRDHRKGIFKIVVCIGLLLIMTGCLKRVEVVTRERLDQEMTGNRGVIYGAVPTAPSTSPPTREYLEWEIEIPTYEIPIPLPSWRREWHDKELWGNRGYLVGGPRAGRALPQEVAPVEAPPEPKVRWPLFRKPKAIATPPAPIDTPYTVKKGDTLGEISSKLYGTSREWKRIYEANRDTLKNPNTLRVGQVLRIPPKRERRPHAPSETIK